MWIVGIYISPRSFNWRERRTGLGHVWIDEDAGIRPIFFATVCPLNGNRSRKKERKILLFILVTLNREGWREEKLGNRFELESGRIESAKNNFLSPSNPSYSNCISVLLCRNDEITMICLRILFALMNFVLYSLWNHVLNWKCICINFYLLENDIRHEEQYR